MIKKLLFLTIITVLTSSGFGQTDAQLLEIAKEGFEARRAGSLAKKYAVPAFKKPFTGLEDSQKIRALVLFHNQIDESNHMRSMSAYTTMKTLGALADDPDFIKDWSSLRQMLNDERDSRKFFLLSKLVPWGRKHHDFIAERTHMLFADGRVAKKEGEYTKEYAHDVSEYTYAAIVGKLRALESDFVPPAENLPHEEQAVILAKWLKKNWPGCENIEIPSRLLSGESRPRKALIENEKSSPPRIKIDEEVMPQETKTQNEKNRLQWIVAGVLLVGILFVLLKTFKGKSTS